MEPIQLVAFSDYLCPWCFNASVRLERLEEEFGDRVRVEFRSFLLRPQAGAPRDLAKFRAYTRSWLRPAAEEDSGSFRVWEGDAGPPTHSVPPQLVAKAAATLGREAFRRLHARLLRAYFAESLDITDAPTLAMLWEQAGLEPAAFARREDPSLLRRVLDEHRQALDLGVSGVPAVMLAHQKIPMTGALPLEMYRRWVRRALDGEV